MSNWWHLVVEKVTWFFNQPVPIIGCTVAALIFLFLTVLSKTSFGKRLLFKLKQQIADFIELVKAWMAQKDEEIRKFKEDVEADALKVGAYVHECTELLDIVCENSHNVKIKEAYAKFKENTSGIKTNFEEYVAKKIEETHLSEIDELKLQMTELSNKVENSLKSPKNDELEQERSEYHEEESEEE